MKKYLTLGNIFKAVAIIFAIIAFCMMFGDQLKYTASILTVSTTYVVGYQDALFGDYGATIAVVGYVFILVGLFSALACAFLQNNKLVNFVLHICSIVFFVLSAIFILCEAQAYKSNIGLDANFTLTACPIVAIIFAFLAALLVVCSLVITLKPDLFKKTK